MYGSVVLRISILNLKIVFGQEWLDMVSSKQNYLFYPKPWHESIGYSKMTSILFSAELQRRLDLENVPIIVTSVHPGTVNTFAHLLPFPRFAHWVLSFLAVTPDEGSWTSLIAAASPILRDDPAKYKGLYLMPVGQVKPPSKQAGDPELAKELWASTEAFLREIKIWSSDLKI